jgi:large subunit ribosomal protein L29
MKMTEINQKTDAELLALLGESRKSLAQLAIDTRTKQVANVKQIQAVKKTIARTLTLQRARQLTHLTTNHLTTSEEENHG